MNIYDILKTRNYNPHYLDKYYSFILGCFIKNKTNNITKLSKYNKEGIYMETHHILPKAKDLFPEYRDLKKNPWNSIDLTPRQHYIAHLILWKCYGGSQALALNYMCSISPKKMTSKIYEELRKDTSINLSKICKGISQSKNHIIKRVNSRKNNGNPWVSKETIDKINKNRKDITGNNNPFFNKKHSKETIEYLSSINRNKVLSQETKDKISTSLKGKIKVFTEKGRATLSQSKIGKNNPMYGIESYNKNKKQNIVLCPKCGKSGGEITMKRWHFSNCKLT